MKGFRIKAISEQATMDIKKVAINDKNTEVSILKENPLEIDFIFKTFMARKFVQPESVELGMRKQFPHLVKDTDYTIEVLP